MILPKYYCEKCKNFKTRKEVKRTDHISCWGYPFHKYECTWCHKPVMKSQEALKAVLADYFEWKEIQDRKYQISLFTTHHKPY